jgi:hypothetical protein
MLRSPFRPIFRGIRAGTPVDIAVLVSRPCATVEVRYGASVVCARLEFDSTQLEVV